MQVADFTEAPKVQGGFESRRGHQAKRPLGGSVGRSGGFQGVSARALGVAPAPILLAALSLAGCGTDPKAESFGIVVGLLFLVSFAYAYQVGKAARREAGVRIVGATRPASLDELLAAAEVLAVKVRGQGVYPAAPPPPQVAVLRRAFRLGIEAEKIHRAPVIRQLQENNVRSGFFDDEKFQALIAAIKDPVIRDIASLGFATGWRKSELLKLEVRQVDARRRAIVLEPGITKGREGRIVFLEGDAWAVVERWYKKRRYSGGISRNLFHRAGEPVKDFRGVWKSACKKAGCPGMLFHDLRRTAIRNMVRAGIQERVAMKISGHRTRSVFDRYNIVAEDDLRDAARKMAARNLPPNSPPIASEGKSDA